MLRAGMVNFINTATIYEPLKASGGVEGWEIVEGHPAELNSLLRRGNLDTGLISSFSYGTYHDDYYIFSDLGISVNGPVGSVFLFSKVPVEQLQGKKICLTCQSATSINLLYIILEYFKGIKPVYETGSFDQFDVDDTVSAYLSIGDEALRLKNLISGLYVYDLAEIWLQQTSHPFIFAVWAVRRESWVKNSAEITKFHDHLNWCYQKGRKDLFRISKNVAGRIPMSVEDCVSYLKGIELDLSHEKQEGLLKFFSLIKEIREFPIVTTLETV